MGAWIETPLARTSSQNLAVALYMGAWIETERFRFRFRFRDVALYMGAWIETERFRFRDSEIQSHSIWVRGLKLFGHAQTEHLQRRTLYGCVD